MAPLARPISREEWRAQENTIRHLHGVEKLHLRSKKEGDRTIVKVMKEDHGFSASLAQYDTQFRKWGLTTNLGKRDLQKLLWQYEEAQKAGWEARIMKAGLVLGELSRKRARKRTEPEQHIGYEITPEKQSYVEFRYGNGPWSRYTDSESLIEVPGAAQNLAQQNDDGQDEDDTTVSALVQNSPVPSSCETGGQDVTASMELVPQSAATSSFPDFSSNPGFGFNYDDPETPSYTLTDHFSSLLETINAGYTDIDGYFMPGLPSNEAAIDSVLNARPLSETFGVGGGFDNVSLEQFGAETIESSSYENLSPSPNRLVKALLQQAKQVVRYHATPFQGTHLLNEQDVIDRLDSLLPEDIRLETTTPDVQVIEKNAGFGLGFEILLYSIANGFAGIRDIPRSSIIKLIRDDQQIQLCLSKLLKMGPCSIAKPLADNLFRAAVESCDPQAVAMIMNITRDRPETTIDPNNIACEFGGRDYTPVELAAKFRNIEIVQALLTAKADPNKTYSKKGTDERGALELAVRIWGKLDRVELKLVELLLSCRAEVRIYLVEAVVRRGAHNMDLLKMLMDKIPDSRHSAVFESRDLLADAIEYLEIGVGNDIVQRFFKACKSTNCGKCASSQPKLLQTLLVMAAKRGNRDLVSFLTPLTEEKQLALAGAVRSGDSQLIDLLLDKGATVDGPGGHLDYYQTKYGPNFSPITTPLAEAIRAQNHSQMQDFEQRGALVCIDKEDHFLAAVFAAAEVGHIAYLQRVLELAPAYRGRYLTPALNIAIRNDQTKAALILIDAGADVNEKSGCPAPGRPLLEALTRRNKEVVDAILESDLDPNAHFLTRHIETSYIEVAAVWGDLKIIHDLVVMGAKLDEGRYTTALTAAVMHRHKPLIEYLLLSGATANARAGFGSSPLEAAVTAGDYDIMTYLISRGASVMDSKAFMYAAKNDPAAYKILLSTLQKLSRTERKGFGGELLIHFITENNSEAVDDLIKLGVDVNRVCFQKTGRRLSPLGFAIEYKKGTSHALVRKLLQAGGDPDGIAAKFEFKSFIEYQQILETPLLLAIQSRNEDMVRILVDAGASVNKRARRGIKRTPLQKACEINSFKIVKFLLQKGAEVNSPPAERDGHTALQFAAINGSIRIARLLLDNDANPHAPSAKVNGKTAFEGAAENGCLSMLHELYTTPYPKSFDREELEKARQCATGRGQRSCVDYIDSLLDASGI